MTDNISRNQFLKWGVLAGGGALFLTNSPKPKATPTIGTFSFEVITVDSYGNKINQENKSAQYQTLDLGNGIGLELVFIPGGEFTMGSPSGELERFDDEGPQHRVTVPGFWMGKYPVTQAQWQRVMGNNPSGFQGEKRPVETISWHDCMKFCKQVSQKLGKKVNLPSEAQWEYACRAGTTTPFHFGETLTTDLANYDGNSTYANGPKGVYRQETTEVGTFPPNAFGLYDMHGNVLEWCLDSYHSNYEGAPADGSAWVDENSDTIIIRGGAWKLKPEYCRSAYRNWYGVDLDFDLYGMRVVLVNEHS